VGDGHDERGLVDGHHQAGEAHETQVAGRDPEHPLALDEGAHRGERRERNGGAQQRDRQGVGLRDLEDSLGGDAERAEEHGRQRDEEES
jgi:hypothetical protein